MDLDAIVSTEKGKILMYPPATPPQPATTPEKRSRKKSAASAETSVASPGPAATTASPEAAATPQPGQSRQATVVSAAEDQSAVGEMPPRGSGLNGPALLTFRRMLVKDRSDSAAVEKFRAKLQVQSLPHKPRLGGTGFQSSVIPSVLPALN